MAKISRCITIESSDGTIWKTKSLPSSSSGKQSSILMDESVGFKQCSMNLAHIFPGVPHTAFLNPFAGADELPRESIELRTLVCYGGTD